jgi:hypothetical protein
MRIPVTSTLALSATLACTIKIDNGDDSTTTTPNTTDADTDTGDATTTPTSTSTTPTGTSGEPTSGTTLDEPTSSEPTTGGPEPAWCHGFNPEAPLGLTVNNRDNDVIMDGSEIQLDCGGQGSLMFPIYPHFGGFIPDNEESVSFAITLDVEGYNVGPGGHFFETGNYNHEVNCAQVEYETYGYYGGYSNAFIAIFPPDAIPDITKVHGKPGVLHVTLQSPGQELTLDANVIMRAVPADFGGVCGYGDPYGETDSDSDSGTDTDTGGSSSTG